MTFDELVNFTLKTLKESIDDEATKDNIRMAYIKGEDKTFYMVNEQEVEEYLKLIQ